MLSKVGFCVTCFAAFRFVIVGQCRDSFFSCSFSTQVMTQLRWQSFEKKKCVKVTSLRTIWLAQPYRFNESYSATSPLDLQPQQTEDLWVGSWDEVSSRISDATATCTSSCCVDFTLDYLQCWENISRQPCGVADLRASIAQDGHSKAPDKAPRAARRQDNSL